MIVFYNLKLSWICGNFPLNSEKVFQNGQFFFYNNTIHPKPKEGSNEVKNLDLKKAYLDDNDE